MSDSAINIGLACGGSGGHISPALTLADSLRKNKFNPHFFTDIRGVHLINPNSCSIISSGSPSVKGFKKFYNIMKLVIGIFQSIYYLNRNKICLVIGFGGYTSVPTVIAAKILKIPSVIHEQNKILGKANRFCLLLCEKIALSFDLKFKLKNSKKQILTGNPISKAFEKVGDKQYLPLSRKRITLLIIGGSQGAKIFSEILPKTIELLPQKIKDKIYIYHQCRYEDKEKIITFYKKIKINYKVESFFDRIYNYFEEADLIISRSGGSTIAEIAAARRPSILIPFPYSTDNHQMENALEFKSKNAAILIEQKKLNEKYLLKTLNKLLIKKDLLSKMAKQARSLHIKDSSHQIIDLVKTIINGRLK
ncbi:MAG: undecaprenyldiphospho-muramoylpentapeptide beta-N-acetylglucosaminyltransferase [SAR116 cluster bacterium]|nr:undecaprenyldiphospho-muramoylpentapeptide beta-N-acetylglucosaminyltransferase [SAR116 cluster bacterium]